MFEPTKLSAVDAARCLNTISSNTFYMMVVNAILQKDELSVVRMGDGEKLLMDMCEGIEADKNHRNVDDPDWMGRLGVLGIEKTDLYCRLKAAANECTYFAPSISGIIRPEFNLYNRFNPRDRYVDNFFVNQWTDEMKENLYKAAGHVLFIHRNVQSFEALRVRAEKIGVEATYLRLDNWKETGAVIERAKRIDAPLVIFSAGPAGKYIGPAIAAGGNIPKVTIDLGNSSDQWLLYHLHDK